MSWGVGDIRYGMKGGGVGKCLGSTYIRLKRLIIKMFAQCFLTLCKSFTYGS